MQLHNIRRLQQNQLMQLLTQTRFTTTDRDTINRILARFKEAMQWRNSDQTNWLDLEWMKTIYLKLFRLEKSLPDVPEWFIAANDVRIYFNQTSMDMGYRECGTWGNGTKVSIIKLSPDDIRLAQ